MATELMLFNETINKLLLMNKKLRIKILPNNKVFHFNSFFFFLTQQ